MTANNGNLAKNTEKMKLLQESFESRFHDISKEDSIFAITNPFSLIEQNITKIPSNIQLELIDVKTHSSLKIKFDEISSVLNASDMIKS